MKTFMKICAAALAATTSTAFAQREMAVAVPPVKNVAEKVAGDGWKCTAVIDQGQDPHMFEPTPRLIERLGGCEVYFQVGLPFEKVLVGRLAKVNPAIKAVELDGGKADAHTHDEAEEHHGHGHSHEGGLDPHGWMSPRKLRQYAGAIAAELSSRDPENAEGYKRRGDEFCNQLEALGGESAERLGKSNVKAFAVYHPAWGHFAEEFGLEQIAVENDGKTPGPRHLETIAAKIKEHGVRTILVQNTREARQVAAFAKRQGLAVVEVQVLGENPVESIRATVDALCDTNSAGDDK